MKGGRRGTFVLYKRMRQRVRLIKTLIYIYPIRQLIGRFSNALCQDTTDEVDKREPDVDFRDRVVARY